MTKIAECGRCGRRLVIWAKGYCKSCYDGARASRELRPEWQRNRSVQPVEHIVEQPKEPKPAPRADSRYGPGRAAAADAAGPVEQAATGDSTAARPEAPALEPFSHRRQVIMRARAALAVA